MLFVRPTLRIVTDFGGAIFGGAMDGQWYFPVQSWGTTVSFHYSIPASSALVQISLSARSDYNEWAVPVAHTIAVWTSYKTKTGTTQLPPLVSAFGANQLTDAYGLMISDNSYSQAIVNFFIWPAVF